MLFWHNNVKSWNGFSLEIRTPVAVELTPKWSFAYQNLWSSMSRKYTGVFLTVKAYHCRKQQIEVGINMSLILIKNKPVRNQDYTNRFIYMSVYVWKFDFT